eukprot:3399798-Alexandrium_andersonii.AAC.1
MPLVSKCWATPNIAVLASPQRTLHSSATQAAVNISKKEARFPCFFAAALRRRNAHTVTMRPDSFNP